VKQSSHYQQTLRLVSRIGRLTNPQHLPVLKEMHISQAQFLVLDALTEAGRALRMSELAWAAGLKDSELTRVIAELESKKWVARAVDPEDGRAKLVKLTLAGTRLIHQAYSEVATQLRGVWSDFTHDEWHRFIDDLQRFETGLRRLRTEADAAQHGGSHGRKGISTGSRHHER
jgi:DNA-binding MarR family transcriptional regulator